MNRFNAVVHKEPAGGKVIAAAPGYAKVGYGPAVVPGLAKVGYGAPSVYHPAAAAYLH